MQILKSAQVLSAESRPYDFDGNKGVSHTVRLLIDGEIYPCKASESLVTEFKSYEGQDADVELDLQSRRERITLHLVGLAQS